jgi:hypothetical protein
MKINLISLLVKLVLHEKTLLHLFLFIHIGAWSLLLLEVEVNAFQFLLELMLEIP